MPFAAEIIFLNGFGHYIDYFFGFANEGRESAGTDTSFCAMRKERAYFNRFCFNFS